MPRILSPCYPCQRGGNSSSRSYSSLTSRNSCYFDTSRITQLSPFLQNSPNTTPRGLPQDTIAKQKRHQNQIASSDPPSLVSSETSMASLQDAILQNQYPSEYISSISRAYKPVRASKDRKQASTCWHMKMSAPEIMADDTWGQFVDVAEEEERLVRHSRILSTHQHRMGRSSWPPLR